MKLTRIHHTHVRSYQRGKINQNFKNGEDRGGREEERSHSIRTKDASSAGHNAQGVYCSGRFLPGCHKVC